MREICSLRLGQRLLVVVLATLGLIVGLVVAWLVFGVRSMFGAFLFTLLPTGWAFCIKGVLPLDLSAGYYRLRPWELSGRVYELLGVRLFQGLLRTPLLRILNLDIPRRFRERDYARAEWEMRFAESSHVLAFLSALLASLIAAVKQWWDAVAYLSAFNVLVNAYPIMLQRYNRRRMERLIARRERRRKG